MQGRLARSIPVVVSPEVMAPVRPVVVPVDIVPVHMVHAYRLEPVPEAAGLCRLHKRNTGYDGRGEGPKDKLHWFLLLRSIPMKRSLRTKGSHLHHRSSDVCWRATLGFVRSCDRPGCRQLCKT